MLLLVACQAPEVEDSPVDSGSSVVTGEPLVCDGAGPASFTDVGAAWGLNDTTSTSENRKEHSPVAFADLDADGDDDVLLANRESGLWLHINEGDHFTVSLVSPTLDLTTIALADIDGDRDLDVLVGGKTQAAELWLNVGGAFNDATVAWGLAELGLTRPIRDGAFGDYDGDGDPDLYLVTSNGGGTDDPAALHRLLRNDGVFVDVSDTLPAAARSGLGWQGVWSDFDRDGDLDLFVANAEQAQAGPSRLLRNDVGAFTDVTETCACGETGSNMGASPADYDGDGWIDLYVTNTGPAVLLENDQAGAFYDVAATLGATAVPDGSWMGFGSAAFDLENDGDLDIFVATGPLYDRAGGTQVADQPDVLLEQADGAYRDVAASVGVADLGAGRGVATGDLNGDGSPDLLVGVVGAPSRLYLSSCSEAHALVVELDQPGANRFGVGARVEVVTAAGRQVRVIDTHPGWAAAAAPRAWFGLGDATTADVTVVWPDGVEERWTVGADQRVVLTRG